MTSVQLQPSLAAVDSSNKVKVHFVAVGSAPILKKTKFQIGADQRFTSVISFLRKILKLQTDAALFLYCSSAFVPAPDQLVGELRDAFAVRDELVIQYSIQEAWG
jgi:ubiquitin-like protein ATG12